MQHILIVDDIEDTRALFSMAFVLAGYRTSNAASASEALELALKHRFDAVLLDIHLPVIDGWKVLELIRQSPLGKEVPIIMFTADHDPQKEVLGEQAGVYAVLRKPMLPEFVIALTEKAIRESRSE